MTRSLSPFKHWWRPCRGIKGIGWTWLWNGNGNSRIVESFAPRIGSQQLKSIQVGPARLNNTIELESELVHGIVFLSLRDSLFWCPPIQESGIPPRIPPPPALATITGHRRLLDRGIGSMGGKKNRIYLMVVPIPTGAVGQSSLSAGGWPPSILATLLAGGGLAPYYSKGPPYSHKLLPDRVYGGGGWEEEFPGGLLMNAA
ncbi:hypothetical protein SUGI_1482630 [Cryptomeria japonica]|uniref:Uncharacterized protein n=1 Tax=Cryptomeria japonica TaxID=3369 RepID=A0AAD3NU61_CRYJA|nr:hypothetical protein SUGI_1482630 [Cryptomeria japonica]